jgi:GTP cyclohydrolase II
MGKEKGMSGGVGEAVPVTYCCAQGTFAQYPVKPGVQFPVVRLHLNTPFGDVFGDFHVDHVDKLIEGLKKAKKEIQDAEVALDQLN